MSATALNVMHLPGAAVIRGPWQGKDTHLVFLEPIDRFSMSDSNSLDESNAWIQRHQATQGSDIPRLAGYLSYEFLHCIESIPTIQTDPYGLPLANFYLYRTVVAVTDNDIVIDVLSDADTAPKKTLWSVEKSAIDAIATALQEIRQTESTLPSTEPIAMERIAAQSNFTPKRYIQAVEEIRELIRDGEVYQANISQQISLEGCSDPWEFFRTLSLTEHGIYSAYISCGDLDAPAAIVSNSPELFFSVSGSTLRTAPIKGTAPRAQNHADDAAAAEALVHSQKNRAELAMIVDLLRNDMGKISVPGSVVVEAFPKLLSLRFIHHLYAPIRSTLRSDVSTMDIFKALFPSGSVTGAPKIAAMQCISAIEQSTRGPYCGSIGWIGLDSMSFNVAIRSGLISGTRCIFQAGGGVTFDSSGEEEYLETLQKAQAFFYTHQKLSQTSLSA